MIAGRLRLVDRERVGQHLAYRSLFGIFFYTL
jgi:hypothetical protein